MSLKSGYFDAESFTTETIEGETVLIPDRAYSPSDMNSYFDGIISSTGVFYQSGDNKQPPFLCEALETSDEENKFKIKIKTGIGRVLGHYIRITGEYYVYVDYGSASGNRWDYIVLRLNQSLRTLKPFVRTGTPVEAGATMSLSLPVLEQPTDANPDIYEIPIAYVYVPMNASASSDIRITPQTGIKACPWITHMVYTEEGEKGIMSRLDSWLTAYQQAINDWLQNLIDNLEVSTSIVQYSKVVSGTNSSTVDLPAVISDYKFNPGDAFNIFYNGLRMTEGIDYTISSSGVLTLRRTSLTGENELYIHILKSQIGVPSYVNGDDILY